MTDDKAFDSQLDDVVELHELADTKMIRNLVIELDEYRRLLGHEPQVYAVFRKHMLGRGGINNAIIRHNDKRRADGKPVVGIRSLRHRGVPVVVRGDA